MNIPDNHTLVLLEPVKKRGQTAFRQPMVSRKLNMTWKVIQKINRLDGLGLATAFAAPNRRALDFTMTARPQAQPGLNPDSFRQNNFATWRGPDN